MAYPLFNRVRQAVASAPGTGAISLSAALSGYRTFAQAGATNGAPVNYVIEDGAAWEYGRGTYSTTGPALTRTKILASSNGGAAINASATATVFCDAFAEDVGAAFKLISSTGELSAAPVAAITFTGLDAYTDLIFEFIGSGHDYTSAQTFSVAISTDGSAFSSATAFTPSISSGSANHGACLLIGNGLRRNTMRCGFTTGSPTEPSIPISTEAPRVLSVSGAIVAVRFTPTTSGNFNKGTLNAYGR